MLVGRELGGRELGGCGGWKAGYGGVAGPLRCEEWRHGLSAQALATAFWSFRRLWTV